MPPRQIWLFQFGCWAAIVTAIVHLAGHIAGPPAPGDDTGRQLLETMAAYRFSFPGGTERSMTDLLDGFSLSFAVLFAALGAMGLVVAKRGQDDRELMYASARIAALASTAVLLVSLLRFFVVPTMFFAAVTVCFAVSAVRSPEPEPEPAGERRGDGPSEGQGQS